MRRWLANKLVSIARRIDPPNDAAMQFYMDRMMDFIITGRSDIKITVVSPTAALEHAEKGSQ